MYPSFPAENEDYQISSEKIINMLNICILLEKGIKIPKMTELRVLKFTDLNSYVFT